MLKELKNVSVELKGNIYFDGKVTSRKVLLEDGSKVTLGIILPGEYEFPVGEKEDVKLIAGNAEVLLPNENTWKAVKQGENFIVIANSKYKIKCNEVVEYICYYIKE